MRGAVPLLPDSPSWLGAQLKEKHRDNFTFICTEILNTDLILLDISRIISVFTAYLLHGAGYSLKSC
jgi:hypothetical protein